MFFVDRLCEYFRLPEHNVRAFLGSPAKNAATWDPNSTFFFDEPRLNELIALLRDAKIEQ